MAFRVANQLLHSPGLKPLNTLTAIRSVPLTASKALSSSLLSSPSPSASLLSSPALSSLPSTWHPRKYSRTLITVTAHPLSPPRYYSTHAHAHAHAHAQPKPTVGAADAQSLVEREQFAKVRRKLEDETRKKITYQEFVTLCANEGLGKEQAKQLAQSLTDAGLILHFGNSSNAILRDYIFLKPVEFNKTVSRILAQLSDDTYLREQVATKQAELTKLKQELQPLEEQRAELHRKAVSRANMILWSGFGYCVLQAAIVARLTWWELSWDVMEPVTYMLTFATVLIGYSFFVLTGSEYTFEGLRKTLERRGFNKLMNKRGFNEEAYFKLKEAIAIREEEVNKLLREIESDPVSLHLKNPDRPIV